MLKCKDIANIASDYLDGEMTLKQKFLVQLHLFICANCKRFMRHLLSTIDYLRRMKRQTAGKAETAQILSLLPDKKD